MSGGASLACLLDAPARRWGERPAVLLGDVAVRTWRGLAEAVARRAGSLAGRFGVRPGDRVAIVATNCPEYLEWLWAVWHAGAVVVPVAARLHPREAAVLVADSAAVLTVATPDLAGGLAGHLPAGSRLLVVGEPDERACATAEPIAPVHRHPGDDAWLFYTSGTTGRAKGARLTHANLLAVAAAYYADVATVDAHDSLVHVAGLSHASGLFAIPFLARGATQVIPESGGFDAAELIGLVAAGERSTFFVPPVALRRLCRSDALSDKAIARLGTVLCGAAPVLAGDLRTAVAALGPRVWNGYGQGESPNTITAMTTADVAAALDRPDRLTSVGTARFGTRVRVVDAAGREVPAGEVGEVVVDGPTVMAGYRDLPGATAETLRGGWLHTGDLGHMDGEGYLHLVDRAKDVIITGGYNVYPREVEDVLADGAGVAEVAVVGVPDEEWGERITAFVVPTGPAAVDTDLLDALCRNSIARYKRPRAYIVVDELPRNPAGKVLKTVLRERAQNRETAQRGTPP